MADDPQRIPVTYVYDVEKKEIHRKKGKGNEIIEDKIVAKYDPETQVVTFPTLNFLRNYKQGVITFLAENEMTIREFERGDIEPDAKPSKAIPPRPKKTKAEGDKTKAVVDWYFKYKPNAFAARYGVLGKYTGPVLILDPVWEPRPLDRQLEYRGTQRVGKEVEDVIVALRKTHLTYTPDECENWDEEEPENYEVAEGGARRHKEDEE